MKQCVDAFTIAMAKHCRFDCPLSSTVGPWYCSWWWWLMIFWNTYIRNKIKIKKSDKHVIVFCRMTTNIWGKQRAMEKRIEAREKRLKIGNFCKMYWMNYPTIYTVHIYILRFIHRRTQPSIPTKSAISGSIFNYLTIQF